MGYIDLPGKEYMTFKFWQELPTKIIAQIYLPTSTAGDFQVNLTKTGLYQILFGVIVK